MKSKNGFTLVELLVVLVLLLALTTTALLSMSRIQKNATNKRYRELIKEVEMAGDIYLSVHPEISERLINSESESECIKIYKLIDEGLLRSDLKNPSTGQRIPANLCIDVSINDGVLESHFDLE